MRRADLISECANCAGLCCIATSFDACEDFAFDKPAGQACRHLGQDARCAIHARLIEQGCSGCAVYDCYGAGPRVLRAFADRQAAQAPRNAAFLALRVIHELLWLLTEAKKLCPSSESEIRTQLTAEIEALDRVAMETPRSWIDLDWRAHHAATHALLRRVGAAIGGRRRRALVVIDSDDRKPHSSARLTGVES